MRSPRPHGRGLRRDPARLLVLNVLLMWTFFHIVFQGEPRYHVPLFPIFAVALAAGAVAAYDRLPALRQRPRQRPRPRPRMASPAPGPH